ncbi:N-acetylmuramoyl-L-alanine amidase [Rossellomorea vietnamensis]|uniref:N-acetylmuramoyl-L-alanine amidase n=1 Tax=Rossellomorea vietnamensis TaxID=218284 RepID=A0A5D4KH88_9BACI|nr:N-acetylmuramoyl-L-alanine amidase [Rossellomorea vietnamensis]TYR75593.1 N-acetylmuramoyl-L-alanine amidase [Rossellomorea vietnamensis]
MIYVVLRDGGHGKGQPGKETPYIKSLGRRIQEEEFNEPVSELFGEEIKRHGVIVHDISAGTHNVPLKERTDEANRLLNYYVRKYGAANVRVVLVSFHFNAFDGTFEGANPSGISVHIQPGSTHARRLAECVGKYLRQGTKQVYRGIVEQNLHITREFDGVGILTENGFMDHQGEAELMLDKDFQKEVARETAQGVLEYFGLSYKEVKKEEVKVAKIEADKVNVSGRDVNVVSEWAEKDWKEVTDNGYFDGKRPGDNLTREEAAIVINRLRRNFLELLQDYK